MILYLSDTIQVLQFNFDLHERHRVETPAFQKNVESSAAPRRLAMVHHVVAAIATGIGLLTDARPWGAGA